MEFPTIEKTKYAVVNWKTEARYFFYTLEDAIKKYREIRCKGIVADAADVFNIEEEEWVRVKVTFN